MPPIDNAIAETVLPSAARTSSGTATAPVVTVGAALRAQLQVTAVSGVAPTLGTTPSFTFSVRWAAL